MTRSTRGSESAHLSSACAQVVIPNSASGAEFVCRRRSADERSRTERAHHDHRDSELLGKRQQHPLAGALARVQRNLDGVEALRAQRAGELVERARRIVGDAELARSGRRPAPPRARAGAPARRRGCGSARPRRGRTSGAARRAGAALRRGRGSRSSSAPAPARAGLRARRRARPRRRRTSARSRSCCTPASSAAPTTSVARAARRRRTCSRCRARRPGRGGAPPSAEQLARGDDRRRTPSGRRAGSSAGPRPMWLSGRPAQASSQPSPASACCRHDLAEAELEHGLRVVGDAAVALSLVGVRAANREHRPTAERRRDVRRVRERERAGAEPRARPDDSWAERADDGVVALGRRVGERSRRRSRIRRRRRGTAQPRSRPRAARAPAGPHGVGERDRQRPALNLDVRDAEPGERRADRRDLAVEGAEDDGQAGERRREVGRSPPCVGATLGPACTAA